MKPPKILFFLRGMSPTDDEQADVDELRAAGAQVSLRNSQHIAEDHRPEECDGVAGVRPANAHRYIKAGVKFAGEVLEKLKDERAKRAALVGDKPAVPADPNAPPASDAGQQPDGGTSDDAKQAATATKPATAAKSSGKPAAWKPNA